MRTPSGCDGTSRREDTPDRVRAMSAQVTLHVSSRELHTQFPLRAYSRMLHLIRSCRSRERRCDSRPGKQRSTLLGVKWSQVHILSARLRSDRVSDPRDRTETPRPFGPSAAYGRDRRIPAHIASQFRNATASRSASVRSALSRNRWAPPRSSDTNG